MDREKQIRRGSIKRGHFGSVKSKQINSSHRDWDGHVLVHALSSVCAG